MGDPKRSRKKWKRHKHPWRREQLVEDLRILGEYGLRNKRELWIAKTFLDKIRRQAKSFLGLSETQYKIHANQLFKKLYKLGIVSENATIDDILDLDVRAVLERRLQTILYKKGLARSIYEARRLIAYGHVMIGDHKVTVPGYIVTRDEENMIKVLLPMPQEV